MNDLELINQAEQLLARMDELMARCAARDAQARAQIARMRETIDQAEAVMARFDQLQS